MAKRDEGFITTGERVRNFIGIAFLISIAIHFVVGSIMPNINRHSEEQQVEKVTMSKRIQVKIPTPPPPTPTPKPTPTPPPEKTPPPKQQVVQPKPLKVNLVKTTSNSASTSTTENTVAQPNKGSESGVPQGQGTAAATGPPATAKPACANPNVEATVVNKVAPEYPDSARDLGLGEVTVQVEVTVASSGNLEDAKIFKSSNNMAMDQAALRAARQSTYSPKLVNCQATTGDYLYVVDFKPDQ